MKLYKDFFVSIVNRVLGIVIVSLLSFSHINAQLCQGSLGDPIVNITFGAGSNPGAPLSAATTNYQYVAADCPNDGYYTVRNTTSNCFTNSWHNVSGDHTGDPNGYFMLVNASIQPSAFYLDRVDGLCSNTTYEFAAWIMNVLAPSACSGSGIMPNLTFTIENTDGTLLQTYNTGNIPTQPSPIWKQYGFFFTTPPGVTDIVLRIFNNSAGGCGNDLALDDITFRPCGPQLTPSVTGFPDNSISYCAGVAKAFTFQCNVSAGFTNPSYQWQQNINGSGWIDITNATTTTLMVNFPATTVAGVYSYRLNAAEAGNMASVKCRIISSVINITVAANPVATANSNSPVCEKSTLMLTASGGTRYDWSGVNGFSATGAAISIPNAQIQQTGAYNVIVTNDAGCVGQASVNVTINPVPVAMTTFSTATICAGTNVQLESSGGVAYQWMPVTGLSSPVISNPFASPADTVQYAVIVSNQFACTDTARITINVIERPRADAGPDKTIIAGNSTQLSGKAYGQDINYSWSPVVNISSAQILEPIVSPAADIDYMLTVVSAAGCGQASDIVHVFVYNDVFVPSAFTPNNDGLNDTWYIPALNAFTTFDIAVFNRYGGLVFHAKDVNKPWDGKYKGMLQPTGVYVYVINLKQAGRILKGTVTLIR